MRSKDWQYVHERMILCRIGSKVALHSIHAKQYSSRTVGKPPSDINSHSHASIAQATSSDAIAKTIL
ncbi:MAG: hypothetical protein ACYCUV_06695 [Phycisphaerae bacterium]